MKQLITCDTLPCKYNVWGICKCEPLMINSERKCVRYCKEGDNNEEIQEAESKRTENEVQETGV